MAEGKATLLLKLRDLASKQLVKIGKQLDKIGKNLNRSKFLFGALGAGISLVGIAALKAAGQFEQWRISFTTMLGSAERADVLLNKIKKFAAETPFDLPQVVKGGRALLAFGVEADKIIPTMKSLGDVSAGLGVPMERLILNFGQVKAQAKLTGRELRDFAVAGVPLLATLAENLNKTEAEIQSMVSKGAIGFKEVEDAFRSMSGEGGRFANLMVKQMDSLEGKFSNVKDVAFQLSVSFGNILLPIVKKLTEAILIFGEKLIKIDDETKKTIVIVAAITTAIAGLTAGLGAFVAISGPLIAAFSIIATVIAPIVAIVGILGFTILGLKDDFITLGQFALSVFNKIAEIISGFFGKLMVFLQEILPDSITNALDSIKDSIGNFSVTTVLGFDFIRDHAIANFQKMKKSAKKNFDLMIKDLKKFIKDSLKEKKKESISEEKIEESLTKKKLTLAEQLAKFRKFLNSQQLADFQSVMGQISSLASSKNKELAAIGKAAAITQSIINTLQGMTLALATIPFPYSLIAAGAVGAAGFATVARITGTKLAEGGIVEPRPGGTLATIGEAGQSEAVIPLDDGAPNVGGITINVGVLLGTEDSVRDLAVMIDEELFSLKRNNESVSFDTVGSSI